MFYIDSHNLTELTNVNDALTGVALTDSEITSITAVLLDSNDVQVGDTITAVYQEPGKWYASWKRTMTAGQTYKLRVTITGKATNGDDIELVIQQTDTAGYRGPRVD